MAFRGGTRILEMSFTPSPLPSLPLRALSSLYRLGWWLYEGSYRWGWRKRVQVSVPVVGIGSLWVGGVSKTPLTIAIAKRLSEQGKRIAVLAHGYGGTRYRQVTLLEPYETADPREVGDETAEIRCVLPEIPIAVGKWRVATAQSAMARWQPDLLVLDDGFQHLPLARTVDLVVLPAECAFSNGYCLPAGPLREPPIGLHRADGVIFIQQEEPTPPLPLPEGLGVRVKLPTFSATIKPLALRPLHAPDLLPLDTLQSTPLRLITAIARPERFLKMVAQLGYRVEAVHTYPDHYHFKPADLRPLGDYPLLMTAKDAVKLRLLLPQEVPAYVLLIGAEVEDVLIEFILQRIG